MSKWEQIEGVVRHYASIPVAILCLAALYLFISIGYRSLLGPIGGATVGALAAVFVLHGLDPEEKNPVTTLPDYRIAGVITCLYVIAIFTMYRFILYERPLAHYVVFGGFAGYIAYEITAGASKARIVPQLLVLTFFTYWSTQLAFPAGMYQPDTRARYLPAINDALVEGTINELIRYLGHLIYVTQNVLITGLSPRIGYFILATTILTGTLLIIVNIDRILPAVSRQVSLYSALFFGCMGWTLSRGLHPGKLSFFYALTLLLGFIVIVQSTDRPQHQQRLWTIIGVVVAPALIFGHRFSAGAALIFVMGIALFMLFVPLIPSTKTSSYPIYRLPAIVFVSAYGIAILGNPIHAEPFAARIVGLGASLLTASGSSGSSTGGPGRYSDLSIDLLVASTAGQAILFGLGILGAAIAVRRAEWEYDLGIFWMGFLAVFLVISLVFNAGDTQPQRFYSLLGLFGLNIFAGVALVYLVRSDISLFTPQTVGVIVCVFAVLSLSSPVAGMHLSIIGDEVPHSRNYETDQLLAGSDWISSYEGNEEIRRTSDLPYEPVSNTTGVVDTTQMQSGERYLYTQSAAETGIIGSSGYGIGDRTYVFLKMGPKNPDSTVYTNGERSVHIR